MENQGNIRTGLRIFETATGLYIYQVFLPGLIVVLKLKCGFLEYNIECTTNTHASSSANCKEGFL